MDYLILNHDVMFMINNHIRELATASEILCDMCNNLPAVQEALMHSTPTHIIHVGSKVLSIAKRPTSDSNVREDDVSSIEA